MVEGGSVTSARLNPDLYPAVDLWRDPPAAAAQFALRLSLRIGEPATGDDIRAAMERIREVLGELAAIAGQRDLEARRKAMAEAPAGAEGETRT